MDKEKHLSEVLSKLIAEREEVIGLNHRINQIESGSDFDAELNFNFSSNKRSAKRYWLNKEEILLVLNNRLKMAESGVSGLEYTYNQIK